MFLLLIVLQLQSSGNSEAVDMSRNYMLLANFKLTFKGFETLVPVDE